MDADFICSLYEEYSDYLATVIRNRLYKGCPSDYIYDCLNDTFEIAVKKQFDSRFQDHPKAWLVQTARHVADNFNRISCYRNQFMDYSSDIESVLNCSDMTENFIYQECIQNHFLEQLRDSLSPNEKRLYYLRYERDFSHKQISEELNTSANAVNARLRRLKTKVRQIIRENIC